MFNQYLVLLAALGFLTSVEAESVRFGIVFDQPGCPVKILSATSTGSHAYETVTISNVTDRQISAVRFAIEIAALDSDEKSNAVVVEGRTIPVSLAAKADAAVSAYVQPLERLLSRARQNRTSWSRADVAISFVEYEDGSTWTAPRSRNGAFERASPFVAGDVAAPRELH